MPIALEYFYKNSVMVTLLVFLKSVLGKSRIACSGKFSKIAIFIKLINALAVFNMMCQITNLSTKPQFSIQDYNRNRLEDKI